MGEIRGDRIREFMDLYWTYESERGSALHEFLRTHNYPSTGDLLYDKRILIQRVYKPILYAVEYEQYANLLVARAEANIKRGGRDDFTAALNENIANTFGKRQVTAIYPNDRYLFEFSHEISGGITLLFLLFLTLTILYEEKRTRMRQLLLSTPSYKAVMRAKFVLLIIMCFLINALFYLQVHLTCRALYQTTSLATLPLYSLKPYLNTPLTISISTYQHLYFLTRCIASLAIVLIAAFITMTSKSQMIAAAKVSLLLFTFAGLNYLGYLNRDIFLIYLNPLTALRTEVLYTQPHQIAIFNQSMWAYQLAWIWNLFLIFISALACNRVVRKEIK